MSADTFSVHFDTNVLDDYPSVNAARTTARPSFTVATPRNTIVTKRAVPLPRLAARHGLRASRAAASKPQQAEPPSQDLRYTFEQVIASSQGEIAYLVRLLRVLHCEAELRRTDGVVTPLQADRSGDGKIPEMMGVAARSANEDIEEDASAPVFDAQGRLFATLRLRSGDRDRSAALTQLLDVLIESAAGAIAERWFRLHHRHQWIVTAQRQDRTEKPIVIAVDRNQRLLGADHWAREVLGLERWDGETDLSLTKFFSVGTGSFSDTPGRDVAARVLRCGDGAPYTMLITSPDPGAMTPCHDERLLLHTRPRREMISHRGCLTPNEEKSSGLPRRRLRRVQEYIDSHLDSALATSELAACAGLSMSHFSRSFMKFVGMTPHSYVLRRRVLRAQQLLEASELSLVEIAISTGFSDQSHFSRRFRELVGLPPRAFRVRHR